MKLKFFLTLILCSISYCIINAQQASRPLYNFSIARSINSESHLPDTYILVDSLGNIYNNNKKLSQTLNIKTFSKAITTYVIKEKIDKIPGEEYEFKIEAPVTKPSKQTINITVQFLDDFKSETDLLTKTSYRWDAELDKDFRDYSLFKYLTKEEADILKSLLE